MFSYKIGGIFTSLVCFCLNFQYLYCFSQFSFFRHRYRTLISSACLMLELGFKQHDLVRTMFTDLAKQLMKPGSVPFSNAPSLSEAPT